MANGAKVALAVGAGYFLGRTRKMRLALMLAAAGVTGKFPPTPSALGAQALKSLGASADLGQLSQQLRGEVLSAARAAALAAATKQVDSLNDRLQGVTSAVGTDEVLDGVGDTVGNVGDTVGSLGESLRPGGRRRSAEQDEDLYDEDEPFDDDQDYDEEPLDVDDEPEDAYFEDDEDEAEPDEDDRPVRSTRRAARQGTSPGISRRRPSRAASGQEPPAPRARRARGTATKAAPVRRGR